ncbi:MAG: PepSY domain-containing protein [Eubacterium sp.]|nr:PepSY domain-containing protein [Eubacterium sp.]
MSVICMVEMLVVIGSISACGVNVGSATPQQGATVTNESQQTTAASNTIPQETTPSKESRQVAVPSTEPQQDTAPSDTAQQDTAQSNTHQQDVPQPAQGGSGQISLDDAKQAALADAGVSASDAQYTKEKLDYEDGIAVYDIEFYAGNTQYEYEINAATGAVYSKSIETFPTQAGNGNGSKMGTSTTYIDVDDAKAIALNHAGFSEADVSCFKSEFDIDDGWAVYEIEFNKGGREYEYKINAADGSIMEYDVD